MNKRDAAMAGDGVTCQICGRSLTADEVVPAEKINGPILEIIMREYPDWSDWGHICQIDLNRLRAEFILKTLEDMRGDLVEMGHKIKSRFEKFERRSKEVTSDTQKGRTFGQRVADGMAKFGGSWRFILSFFAFLIFWGILNTVMLSRHPFDPYPFILLNLVLSCIAALQAPVIMMSQNRVEARDRERARYDLLVNMKAEMEIKNLDDKVDLLVSQQWQKLLEIQQIQIELIAEMAQKSRK